MLIRVEIGIDAPGIDALLRRTFGGDAEALMDGPFTVVTPDSKNPYRQMYAAN